MKTTGLLQGTLDMLILRTLLFGPAHGHQIAKHIQSTTDDILRLEHGSLYPALHRLEQQALISSEWGETDTGREAKFYELTKTGRAALKSETAQWERLSAAVGLVLRNA
jgi:transcriptional regulator